MAAVPRRLLSACAVVLAGYLAGRWLFERSDAWLMAGGVSAGLAAVVALAPYAALVVAAIRVAVWLAGPPADPRPALRGFRATTLPTAGALVLAALLVVAVYGFAVAARWAVLERASPTMHLATGLAGYAVLYAGIAANEELVFRGVLLGLLGRWVGLTAGVALTSALFAAVHVAASVTWGRMAGVFLLGLLLALFRLRSGSLWPAIAAHWSFHVLSYAAVLGLPPLRVALTGPVALVGTADQLDAGLLMILALAAAVSGGLLATRGRPLAAADPRRDTRPGADGGPRT
jgi:membrane protease YdiL (CAAX protease family)